MKIYVIFYTKHWVVYLLRERKRERENGRLCLCMFELYNSKHCAYIQFE